MTQREQPPIRRSDRNEENEVNDVETIKQKRIRVRDTVEGLRDGLTALLTAGMENDARVEITRHSLDIPGFVYVTATWEVEQCYMPDCPNDAWWEREFVKGCVEHSFDAINAANEALEAVDTV